VATEHDVPAATVVSNTEDVYLRVRSMVLNGEIAPGAVISQVKLARELGVSTTPLREAMRLLQSEGLLLAEHNRRTRVAPLSPRDVDAVYASRILIESLAVRLTVAAMRADDVRVLREDLEAMVGAAELRDTALWEPVHRRFHHRLIAGCGPAMTRIVEPVVDRSERARRYSMFGSPARTWEVGNDEHQAIVEACEARDAELAARLLARHLARSALTVLAKISPEDEPVAVRGALQLVASAPTA
jgi:DNA-binding GntR family transcriptional regulator